MAINLNGFEKTPSDERQVLSIEQFNSYLTATAKNYEEKLTAYIVSEIVKRGNFDYESMYEEYGITSKEEFLDMINEELGLDVLVINSKKLLKSIPKEVLEENRDLDSLIDSAHNAEDMENILNSLHTDTAEILYTEKLIQIATEVSKYDLSQIPPELYAQTNFLRYINFQNTGAKLDFDYIMENSDTRRIYISSKN